MEFLKRFFKFPVRIYDPYSIDEVEKRRQEDGVTDDPDYIVGWRTVYVEDITSWGDTFTAANADFAKIAKEGFDCTSVFVREQGEYICPWKVDKFEKKLGEAWQKLTDYMTELEDEGTSE